MVLAGATINLGSDSGETPLSFAASSGHLGTARVLVELKADINLKDANGCNALFYAVESSPTLTMLIEAGGDVNAADKEGDTLLHAVADSGKPGHESTLTLLLARGARPDARNNLGATPLHTACAAGCLACSTALLHAHNNIASVTRMGLTPLHAAALSSSRELVAMLLTLGADPAKPDAAGRTPAAYAVADEGLADLLPVRGSSPSSRSARNSIVSAIAGEQFPSGEKTHGEDVSTETAGGEVSERADGTAAAVGPVDTAVTAAVAVHDADTKSRAEHESQQQPAATETESAPRVAAAHESDTSSNPDSGVTVTDSSSAPAAGAATTADEHASGTAASET